MSLATGRNSSPTLRQLEVLKFIHDGCRRGLVPTIQEIADKFGLASRNGVVDHLRALEDRGLLDKDTRKARSLRVTSLGLRYLQVPTKKCGQCGSEVAA